MASIFTTTVLSELYHMRDAACPRRESFRLENGHETKNS